MLNVIQSSLPVVVVYFGPAIPEAFAIPDDVTKTVYMLMMLRGLELLYTFET